MTSNAALFGREFPVTAGWRYPSGGGHYAHDYGTPIGTPLYAPLDGRVGDVRSGVPNNPPGVNPGSGSPVNYVLLWCKWDTQPVTILLNHLSPAVKVRTGDRVTAGELLGHTGNSGNSTGPHTHVAAQLGHTLDRYRYMQNDGQNPWIIYPPDAVWKDADMPLSNDDLDKIARRVWGLEIATEAGGKDSLPARTFLRRTYSRSGKNQGPTRKEIAETVWSFDVSAKSSTDELPAAKALRQARKAETSEPDSSSSSSSKGGRHRAPAEPHVVSMRLVYLVLLCFIAATGGAALAGYLAAGGRIGL